LFSSFLRDFFGCETPVFDQRHRDREG